MTHHGADSLGDFVEVALGILYFSERYQLVREKFAWIGNPVHMRRAMEWSIRDCVATEPQQRSSKNRRKLRELVEEVDRWSTIEELCKRIAKIPIEPLNRERLALESKDLYTCAQCHAVINWKVSRSMFARGERPGWGPWTSNDTKGYVVCAVCILRHERDGAWYEWNVSDESPQGEWIDSSEAIRVACGRELGSQFYDKVSNWFVNSQCQDGLRDDEACYACRRTGPRPPIPNRSGLVYEMVKGMSAVNADRVGDELNKEKRVLQSIKTTLSAASTRMLWLPKGTCRIVNDARTLPWLQV